MNSLFPISDFLKKTRDIIHQNISNEQFGVSELADAIGMSRSNLLRKIKKETGSSVSVFIRDIRLEYSTELLKDNELTVSEISYMVGFSSPSYFIKCFHDKYGYSPGDKSKNTVNEEKLSEQSTLRNKKGSLVVLISVLMIIVLAIVIYFSFSKLRFVNVSKDRSIAVLPFRNDSDDSSNIYIINGLMESVLGNLQLISDLRVISRTSVEKFRNSKKTIPEISNELNVRYIIEGSGQKLDNQILLSVQLIDANTDKRIWSKQYNKDLVDVFTIQREIAHNISDNIGAIITPEEMNRIDKPPTNNLVAYDFFLKGLDLMFSGERNDIERAIDWFKKAIDEDPEFARAYADIAISYYFLDQNRTDKQYIDQINTYADKALLLDDELEQSYIAKALYYQLTAQYDKAVPYLEKALDFNPNSAVVVGMLAHIYATYLPDITKYLEYGILAARLEIGSYDSVTASYTYLHISNALIQNGMGDEALEFIDRSLGYFPENIFSLSVKAYILFAKNGDLNKTKNMLLSTLMIDTNRLDVMQEVGKIYYYLREYDSAYFYYNKYLNLKQAYDLDIYPGENAKIAYVMYNQGYIKEADKLLEEYRNYAENDETVYNNLSLSAYYAMVGKNDESLRYLRMFSEKDNYFYWIVLFLEIDPIFEKMKNDEQFIEINKTIEQNFYSKSIKTKNMLIEKGIIE